MAPCLVGLSLGSPSQTGLTAVQRVRGEGRVAPLKMKGLQLGRELKEHLEVLLTLDGEEFEQVVAISAAQLHSGAPGAKAIKSAASTLNVGPEELSVALEALSFVIAESARQQLSEQDLRTALTEQVRRAARLLDNDGCCLLACVAQ